MNMNKICRCCLAKGATKDLSTSYTFIEKEEIYSEMLQECFNIGLSPRANNNCICEVCVKNLRDSFYFKQQVLKAEQAFLIRLSCEEQDTKPQVKTEPELEPEPELELEPEPELEPDPEQSYCDSDNIVDAIKEESPDDATDTIIQTETITETEQRTTRAMSQKTEEDHEEIPDLETKLTTNSDKLPTLKISKQKSSTKKEKEKQSPADITWVKKSVADKQKHRDNLLTVLKYSNVVPFRHKNLLGFVCGYCDATYPDPLDLRSHTEKEHEKERFLFKSSFDMAEFSVKLDITDLICKICATKIDNLTKLKDHLVNKHNKKIHNDIKDHLMQFKLKKGEVYDCVMCPSTYETFKMLKQHMNKHYDNYSCNKCENSFATKRSLSAHRGTHKEGSFKCDLCEKVFMSRTKKHYHKKIQHMGTRNISNCMLCDAPFRSYYQRNQHMIKVHNSEAQYKCNVCDKVYILKSLLMCHIKKSHLMEKNCQCTECGYKFFSNKALKAHMVKHTGEKNYACEVCHKSYARKYTLREHMRIHNNDRRFRCEVCATSFVQKCSLKSHLLSHHGISLAASDIVSIS